MAILWTTGEVISEYALIIRIYIIDQNKRTIPLVIKVFGAI